jgi:hypothetical protein
VDSKKLREVLTIAALARMSLPNDHPNKLNSTSAATAYKLRRVTLGDRFKALGEDKSIPVPIPLGRKCPISNECFNAIIDFYEAAKSGKVQPDTEDFTRKVEEYRKSTTSPALSAKDPKSQLKARKNMWEELVLTVILPAVIKARAEWVRKEQIKNPKFVPPNEDDEILRALLTMDGAFSELEATVALEEELTRFFCEIFKYPGGCSLSYQPNDLMRGFMNFRSKMGSPPKEDLSQDLWSMLAYNVFDILTKSGMDKASVILYTLVYFHRLPEILVASC